MATRPSVTPAPLLRAEGLTRQVDGRVIVDHVTVELHAGEVLAVVGASGSGKSSFLRLLSRLDEPTGGTVYLHGLDYRALPTRELRRRVGLVLQSAWLFPGTVEDNLRFGPAARGQPLDDAAVEDLLRGVDLAGYGARAVERLSGGEAQRVALARTLANGPEAILLDEPTSALDAAARDGVELLLRDVMADRSLACVLVSHDPGQVRRLAHRVIVFEGGRVARQGTPEEAL